MRRRNFLAAAGAVTAAASSFAAPAIAQGAREIKLVTSWPKDLPGLGTSAARLAKLITDTSGGRLQVEMFPAGDMVAPFEVFDAVSAGIVALWTHRQRDELLDLPGRWPGALGRVERLLRYQTDAGF
jgi:TRAP-type mannitol/chloroaromatic compound transport system substrate-binding protein